MRIITCTKRLIIAGIVVSLISTNLFRVSKLVRTDCISGYITVSAASEDSTIAPENPVHSLGENVEWNIKDNVLTISGTGEISNIHPSGLYWYIRSFEEFETVASSIETIVIEDGITNIPDKMFCWFELLKNIEIPGSIISIGADAFSDCKSLESVNIHDGVKYIGDMAFAYCKKLRRVVIPNSVDSIGIDIIFSGEYSMFGSKKIYKSSICAPEGSYAHKYAIENDLIYFPSSKMNPVTLDEYNAYLLENGNLSVYGKCIVYCDEVIKGYQIFTNSSKSGATNSANEYIISSDEDSNENNSNKTVKIFVATKSGKSDWILTYVRGWVDEIIIGRWNFLIDRDLNVEMLTLKGDLNKDQMINFIDCILLKNIILSGNEMVDCETADLSNDGIVNILDLYAILRVFL